MNINDRVFILDTCEKYKDYPIKGNIGTIKQIYGDIDRNYAIKIDGIFNTASKDGLFYLKEKFLMSFMDQPVVLPAKAIRFNICDDIKALVPQLNIKKFIKKVIFNSPATIVYWIDGTKTVVKRQPGELFNRFDKEKGLALAIIKKLCGNTGKYYEIFKEQIDD